MEVKMNDVYDEAVDYFKARPESIGKAWASPSVHAYGFLFGFITPSRFIEERKRCVDFELLRYCGCASQVASGSREAYTPELTELCRTYYLPGNFDYLEPSDQVRHLETFAVIQRETDRVLHRAVPDCSMWGD
jgi:hypothetical protein